MKEISEQDLEEYRDDAEQDRDAPFPDEASRPGRGRAKVLSVRLNPEEFDELARFAAAREVPASAVVRGWILDHLSASSGSPVTTVDRIAHELERLRRQLAA